MASSPLFVNITKQKRPHYSLEVRTYFVYLLECEDRSLYAGITTDVLRRLREHKIGDGGRYTRSHGAKQILYTEQCMTRGAALRREVEIKRLNRTQKLQLVTLS